MDLQLHDRALVVTGGTSGLGYAAAEALVDEGARVLVSSRDPEHVDEAVARLGDRASGLAADITDAATPGRLIAACRTTFGRLDGAFISHGGPPAGAAAGMDDEMLHRALSLATAGPIRLLRDVVAELDDGGAVVVLTSSSSVQPIPGLATSNLARPAVWGYAKTLADEAGARGVRINVLLPGRIATERVAELDAGEAQRRGISADEVRAETESRIPLRRLGNPEELGRVAAFLMSPAASYVTGAAWAVDGGSIRAL